MSKIRVSINIDAAPALVWAEVEVIERHVNWMADAVSITFHGHQRSGVGTTFDCATRMGPFRLTDRMEITRWHEGTTIGVRHTGLVTGLGEFNLGENASGGTIFTWSEELKFPLWLGGAVTGLVGGRVMERIWRKNLKTLKTIVESVEPGC